MPVIAESSPRPAFGIFYEMDTSDFDEFLVLGPVVREAIEEAAQPVKVK